MKKRQNPNTNYSLAHVLYQKLGSEWYAFTEVDGDCFMTKVSEEAVENYQRAEQHDSHAETRAKRRAA